MVVAVGVEARVVNFELSVRGTWLFRPLNIFVNYSAAEHAREPPVKPVGGTGIHKFFT